MKKIASFQVNHLNLLPGLYVSRTDMVGSEHITTFDIRMTRPNFEPVMNNAEIHAIEHLGATFLRNHEDWKDKVVYFGPMGCRTGFYLILSGEYATGKNIMDLMKEMFTFIRDYEGTIPGASAVECGNFLDLNLPMAKYWGKEFLKRLETASFTYPE